MRPHVELIDERDLLWHVAEFPHASGEARQRNLSYDEENGAASLSIEFMSDWERPAGLHAAQTEWYVLRGSVAIGEHRLGAGSYWCAPRGAWTPAISAAKGTEILIFREYAGWQFMPMAADGPGIDPQVQLVIRDTEAMDWYDVEDPDNGSPMDFDRGGTPVPGLFIKLLYRDPVTGFYTRLIKAKPGWREHPLAHHPVYEEAYCLDGEFEVPTTYRDENRRELSLSV